MQITPLHDPHLFNNPCSDSRGLAFGMKEMSLPKIKLCFRCWFELLLSALTLVMTSAIKSATDPPVSHNLSKITFYDFIFMFIIIGAW